jgi:probable rRNA maturation factor
MILNRQREVRISRRPLELFLRRVKRELRLANSEITICLVSDGEMARLNQNFRKKKGPTDVLSFPSISKRRPQWPWRARSSKGPREDLGDIAISPATARRYARRDGRDFRKELPVLILHGVLHLLGYDHETDRGEMDKIEKKLRVRLGIA